jgi:hypoxanthine phosphoribosyltransferase
MNQLRSLIPTQDLQDRIRELGREIRVEHGEGSLTCICVLRGALFFAADLVRNIGGDVRLEFVHIKNKSDSLDIEVAYLSGNVTGQDCILIEDIVETGLTLRSIRSYLLQHQPRSIRAVSLLDKPSTRHHRIDIDFIGFSIPDEFVVGYGLDLHGQHRALDHIATYIP